MLTIVSKKSVNLTIELTLWIYVKRRVKITTFCRNSSTQTPCCYKEIWSLLTEILFWLISFTKRTLIMHFFYFSILSFTLPPSLYYCIFISPYWLKSSFIFSLLFFLSHSLFSLCLWKRRLNYKFFHIIDVIIHLIKTYIKLF